MIIVSQNKNEIVNFENMNNIIIENYDFKDKHFQRINAKTDGDYFVLGDYKTEERAKEVLKEIIQKSKDISLANLMDNLQIAIHNKNFNGALSSVYYMPED